MESKQSQAITIYGIRAVMEALASGKSIEKVWLIKNSNNTQFNHLQQQLHQHKIAISYVPKERFDRFEHKNHQGVAAQMAAVSTVDIETLLAQLTEKKTPLLILLDGVTDVRNFGAILRTAAAVGVDGVVVPASGSAPLNGDAVKTSAGGIFKVPIVKTNHLKDVIYHLQSANYTLFAVTEKTSNLLYKADFKRPTAIVLGAEDKGISKGLLKLVPQQVKIPMVQSTDSLNVSVAAAVVLYEIVRQRL